VDFANARTHDEWKTKQKSASALMGFAAILHVGKCNITPKMHYFAKKCHKNGISKMKCVKKCNFSGIKKCLPLHPL
jgi:hypothetical protein